ncbi:hypothetical protein P8452_42518 [Trifolium repens]|nr:hypothetical protein P8452_42518 [Trifolium repens]
MGEAKVYLNEVKDAFKDEIEKYDDFLWMMKDYREKRLNVEGVISKVKELFEGHTELLLKFNTFLPDGYEITPPQNEPTEIRETKNFAKKYLDKVKTRFESEPHVYESFMDLLNTYKNQDKIIDEELFQMVISLFQGHPDLVDGFTHFFPST